MLDKYKKKDKITNLINSEIDKINHKLNKKQLNEKQPISDEFYENAHNKIKNTIDKIYLNESNIFSYQDYVKRKEFLLEFKPNVQNKYDTVILSIISGFISSKITDFLDENIMLEKYSNIISFVINIIMYFIILFFIFYSIVFIILFFSKQKLFSHTDNYNTYDYEIKLLENKLDEYDKKRTQVKVHKKTIKKINHIT